MRGFTAGILALVPASAGAAAGEQDDLVFDQLGLRWLERHKITEPESHALGKAGILARSFAHLQVGLFEVYVPGEPLSSGESVEDVAGALQALAAAQGRWLAWLSGASGAEAEAVGAGLGVWKAKTFAGAELGGTDLAERLTPGARTSLSAFNQRLLSGADLGLTQALDPVRLVLFPQRSEFVEFTCLTAWLDPVLRPSAWNEGVTTWLEYDADGTRLVALQYSAGPGDWRKGVGVAERNPKALKELVAQIAGRAVLARTYADLDPALASALANALVIDLYGELDTRIDGDVRARSSQGRSEFVPGGNPNGGTLPATSAENRWRGSKGKDHFVGILSEVQKRSGKKGSSKAEKLASFELQDDRGAAAETVRAPFLGPGGTPPSAKAWPDYLELVRCYGVGFVSWLRSAGAGKESESTKRFGELLKALAQRGETPLAQVFQTVYGQPLSAGDSAALFAGDTLEGRFLSWLAKQR